MKMKTEKKKTEKINETKSLFFRKKNKPLAKLTHKKI